jgi:hypothetical protein
MASVRFLEERDAIDAAAHQCQRMTQFLFARLLYVVWRAFSGPPQGVPIATYCLQFEQMPSDVVLKQMRPSGLTSWGLAFK